MQHVNISLLNYSYAVSFPRNLRTIAVAYLEFHLEHLYGSFGPRWPGVRYQPGRGSSLLYAVVNVSHFSHHYICGVMDSISSAVVVTAKGLAPT